MAITNKPDFRYYIDWNGDGDFSDPDEDITDYVMSAKWRLGFRRAFQSVADETRLTLQLNNVDKRFSPEFTGSPYTGNIKPHKQVKVESTHKGTTRTHYRGYIAPDGIRVSTTWYNAKATLEFIGPNHFLRQSQLYLPLLTNVTADEVIEEILNRIQFPPVQAGAWVLGIVGSSELGTSTYIGSAGSFYDFDTGQLTFPYVGDNWFHDDGQGNPFLPIQGITDAVVSERGKFFFARDGKATFWNRAHLQKAVTVAAIFDSPAKGVTSSHIVPQAMRYAYGSSRVNPVRVRVHPRSVGGSAETLWQNQEDIVVKRQSTKVIRARFEDDSGGTIAGQSITTPNTGDGSLVLSRGTVTVTVENAARSSEITLENTGSKNAIITTLKINGIKITSHDEIEVEAADAQGIFDHGRKELSINARLLSDEDEANTIANWELARRKDPAGEMQSLMLKYEPGLEDNTRLDQMLIRTIGDRITVSNDQTAHSSVDYFITGEEWTWGQKGMQVETRWNLEPASFYKAWILDTVGYSELGTTTYLAA